MLAKTLEAIIEAGENNDSHFGHREATPENQDGTLNFYDKLNQYVQDNKEATDSFAYLGEVKIIDHQSHYFDGKKNVYTNLISLEVAGRGFPCTDPVVTIQKHENGKMTAFGEGEIEVFKQSAKGFDENFKAYELNKKLCAALTRKPEATHARSLKI